MSNDDWLGGELTSTKRKSKARAPFYDEPIDDTFDALLDSASKTANAAASLRSKPEQRSIVGGAGGWSNDPDDDDDASGGNTNILPSQPSVMRQNSRRAAEEIIATNIPTISMDEIHEDEAIDEIPEVAVAPEFSAHHIASFKDMENEFSRERASQYIDSKVDISILYQNLHLQEELDTEDQKPWEWDKLFVEIRNAITNPSTDF